MGSFDYLSIILFAFVFFVGWYLTNRKVKAGFREYIDFYIEQNKFNLLRYKVLWFSSGNFKVPWYKIFTPMVPGGSSSNTMYIELIVSDEYGAEKNVTCRLRSEGFYIVDAEFME